MASSGRDQRRLGGLFVGLATLDVIHRVTRSPETNEKVTALAQFVAAGGPAANAAVTFAALGGAATLITALGSGTIASTIRSELEGCGVTVIDVDPAMPGDAPVSSVAVIDATGERSVIGGDASGVRAPGPDPDQLSELLGAVEVVLIDGHHPEIARQALAAAQSAGVPSVLDAGRWKPIMGELVTRVTDVVLSADFRVPGTFTPEATAAELISQGCELVVTTDGPAPVRWMSRRKGDAAASGSAAVPRVEAVDTLGAGDVFHGAYAYGLAVKLNVPDRIDFANRVAAARCSMVGPRSWLGAISRVPVLDSQK